MNDDASSIGQASAAVAMANDAIDNARRAAASSRSRRAAAAAAAAAASSSQSQLQPRASYDYGSAPSGGSAVMANRSDGGAPQTPTRSTRPVPGAADFAKSGPVGHGGGGGGSPPSLSSSSSYSDLRHNDNAYHVIATLVTERLMPKIDASPESTHYTVTAEDTAFFQKMLPHSVRKSFVDALRYRSQLLKSGVGSRDSALGRLTMHCQMLGLDRDHSNVLLDLSKSAGRSYPINYKNQGPVAVPSPPKKDRYASNNDQYSIDAGNGDNGVTFGLSSPMAFSPANNSATVSPANNSHSNNAAANYSFHAGTNDGEWETSAESLARQQIMAEINETKLLMRGSVTPDAVNFWKKHLEELSQRLVALSLEEQLKAAGSGGSVVGSVNAGYGGDNYDEYNKVKGHYQVPPSVRPREEYAGGNVVTGSPAEVGRYHQHGDPNVVEANIEAVASMPARGQREELPVCDVVAPSDLPGGYMFEAQLGSKKFLATVPPGGVTKGQRFVSTMRELETIEIPVPLGAWRDGARDCFNDGILHPLFLNTIFFPCIALGQIMTRTGLDWQGDPANKLVSSLSCANMTVLLTFWLAMNASFAFMLRVAWERGRLIGYEYYAVLALFNLFVLLYMVNLTRKVRESIRNKYQIPEETCVGLEDCLCATFCMPCAICQMGRHTADFDTYRATCCTKTGLPRQVELAPVTFYEDQYQNMNEESRVHVI
mmetsp:Transcript_57336/g.121661  ORF Transcript_57336/g.121661 Transcript_57336/m.121661 type:complete len:712 (-) Transcript_57336:221-2356(-)